MASPRLLKTCVFFGSSRDISPPWGGASRLGDRVHTYVKSVLESRCEAVGEGEGAQKVSHEITFFDPLEVFGDGGALAASGCEMKHPHFFHKVSLLV